MDNKYTEKISKEILKSNLNSDSKVMHVCGSGFSKSNTFIAPYIGPNLINGKIVSDVLKEKIKEEIDSIKSEGKEISLAVIIVGNNPASRTYVNNKKKACEYVGIKSLEYALPESKTEEELINLIEQLNNDKTVNGILCQLPLPKHLNENKIIEAITPEKDVDCFSYENIGKLWTGKYEISPCTPMGVIELLNFYNIDVAGKHCVIIGRSNIVGKPMAALLLERNATVTICHSKTQNLSQFTQNADIVIVAVGKSKFLKADMIKEEAIVIDIGINRDENGKLCGDVDFENVKEKVSYITPVPGGCGPMTIAVLIKNTLNAYKNQNNLT